MMARFNGMNIRANSRKFLDELILCLDSVWLAKKYLVPVTENRSFEFPSFTFDGSYSSCLLPVDCGPKSLVWISF